MYVIWTDHPDGEYVKKVVIEHNSITDSDSVYLVFHTNDINLAEAWENNDIHLDRIVGALNENVDSENDSHEYKPIEITRGTIERYPQYTKINKRRNSR